MKQLCQFLFMQQNQLSSINCYPSNFRKKFEIQTIHIYIYICSQICCLIQIYMTCELGGKALYSQDQSDKAQNLGNKKNRIFILTTHIRKMLAVSKLIQFCLKKRNYNYSARGGLMAKQESTLLFDFQTLLSIFFQVDLVTYYLFNILVSLLLFTNYCMGEAFQIFVGSFMKKKKTRKLSIPLNFSVRKEKVKILEKIDNVTTRF